MIVEFIKRWFFKIISSDRVAMLIFTISTGILTVLYEMVIAKLTVKQWIGIRILKNILRFGGARFCSMLTDWMRIRFAANSANRLQRMLADSVALAMYQLPIFALSALCMGANRKQIVLTTLIYFADNLLIGWLYGVILDRIRSRMATK